MNGVALPANDLKDLRVIKVINDFNDFNPTFPKKFFLAIFEGY